MKEKVLIHIGYHKTGTTWFQNELFVSGNPIFEPFSLGSKGHSSLVYYYIWTMESTQDKGYMLSPFDFNFDLINEKICEIKNKKFFDTKIPVFSSERLSGLPYAGGYDSKTIALRLKKTLPDSKIFIVIREQQSMILSTYLQYLTEGGIRSLKNFLNIKYDGRMPSFSPFIFDYRHLIIEYINLFGRENVLVLPYEMFKNEKEFFFTKLSEFIN